MLLLKKFCFYASFSAMLAAIAPLPLAQAAIGSCATTGREIEALLAPTDARLHICIVQSQPLLCGAREAALRCQQLDLGESDGLVERALETAANNIRVQGENVALRALLSPERVEAAKVFVRERRRVISAYLFLLQYREFSFSISTAANFDLGLAISAGSAASQECAIEGLGAIYELQLLFGVDAALNNCQDPAPLRNFLEFVRTHKDFLQASLRELGVTMINLEESRNFAKPETAIRLFTVDGDTIYSIATDRPDEFLADVERQLASRRSSLR